MIPPCQIAWHAKKTPKLTKEFRATQSRRLKQAMSSTSKIGKRNTTYELEDRALADPIFQPEASHRDSLLDVLFARIGKQS